MTRAVLYRVGEVERAAFGVRQRKLPLSYAAAKPRRGSYAAAIQGGDSRRRTPKPALRAGRGGS